MRRICRLFLVGLLLSQICPINCDLPIHVLNSDVLGLWRILEVEDLKESPQTCGSTVPNSNLEILKLYNYKTYLEEHFGTLKEQIIELTVERNYHRNEIHPRNTWRYFTIKDHDTNDNIGYWTLVYDEGLDLTIGDYKYFGYFKYDIIKSGECKELTDSAQEDESGNIKCYKSDPSKLHIGWMSKKIAKDGVTKYRWGCFYAEKLVKSPGNSYVIDGLGLNRDDVDSGSNLNNLWERKEYKQFSDLSPLRFLQLHKGVDYLHIHHSIMKSPRLLQKYIVGKHKYACKKTDKRTHTLPKEWFVEVADGTWGDGFGAMPRNDLQEYCQGLCGSCYAMSAVYALGRRFEILLSKLYPKNDWSTNDFALSVQEIVSCSHFTQGCNGGFPYLVGKYAAEYGLTYENKFPYKMEKNDTLPKCNLNKDETKWYAKGYGYVGGCYECTSEVEMMNEIYHHGPIVTAIDAPPSLFYYSGGIFNDSSKHGYTCDLPHHHLNGRFPQDEVATIRRIPLPHPLCWEYTNHAVVIVGWGEEEVNGVIERYWLVRNTWGNDWGVKGFVKVKRGVNLCGIESQAVYIDPDLTRGIGYTLVKGGQKHDL